LKSRLQLDHVPVHEPHSAKVRKIPTTSKTPSLTRIVPPLLIPDLNCNSIVKLVYSAGSLFSGQGVTKADAEAKWLKKAAELGCAECM